MLSLLSIYLWCDFNIKSNILCKADLVFLAFNITDKIKNYYGHALYIHCLMHYYNTSQVLEQTTKIKKLKKCSILVWFKSQSCGLSLQNFFYVTQIQLKTKTCNTICRCNEIQNKNKPPQYKLTLTMYAVNAKRTE